ncbi:hypothetical protein [Planococcus versutus]|uniref:Phage head morphogenesis domain-containing protein n=1 Tax=Planococcus versutus TaxID=1302659 RepID=A0A1B1S5I3_9BACL|nr:hypothetical protein [Planococcus versutus]ANU28447.1 hypothetical protein I858_015770 [Planococcus versutus]
MNQTDIERRLDQELAKTESQLQKQMLTMQKAILLQLSAMYQKYERDGVLSYQEMNKYNRLENELRAIAGIATTQYQKVVAEVQEVEESHYLLNFLLTAYLFDQFIARPSLPTTEVIGAVFLFILGTFKLPKLPGGKQSEVVVNIEKALQKGVDSGDSQANLVKRIESTLPSLLKSEKGLAEQLTDALTERLEVRVNVGKIDIPKLSEIRKEVKIDGLTLTHFLTVKRNRLVARIRKQIGIALRKNETVSQLNKRISELIEKENNSLRLFLRDVSDRVRALALGNVENQITAISDVRGVWLSKRDGIVRKAHRKLDGQRTDRKGYFHYQGLKAIGPRMWGVPGMDNYCRCKKLTLLDFKVPMVAEGVVYNNDEYKRQLEALTKKKVDAGAVYEKAFAEAIKEIPEPQSNMPFVSYEEWLKIMGVKGV